MQDAAILHTTLARLLRLPASAAAGRVLRSGAPDGAALLRSTIARISVELCGLRATLPTLWCSFPRQVNALTNGTRQLASAEHCTELWCLK